MVGGRGLPTCYGLVCTVIVTNFFDRVYLFFPFQASEVKDYQLWVKLGNDESPYPLIGEYIILMVAVRAHIDTLYTKARIFLLVDLRDFFFQI